MRGLTNECPVGKEGASLVDTVVLILSSSVMLNSTSLVDSGDSSSWLDVKDDAIEEDSVEKLP